MPYRLTDTQPEKVQDEPHEITVDEAIANVQAEMLATEDTPEAWTTRNREKAISQRKHTALMLLHHRKRTVDALKKRSLDGNADIVVPSMPLKVELRECDCGDIRTSMPPEPKEKRDRCHSCGGPTTVILSYGVKAKKWIEVSA